MLVPREYSVVFNLQLTTGDYLRICYSFVIINRGKGSFKKYLRSQWEGGGHSKSLQEGGGVVL